MNKINIGIAGCGVVGGGVVEHLLKKKSAILSKSNVNLAIRKILVKNQSKKRKLIIPRGLMTTDYRELINDPNIHIIVELIGGINLAKKIVVSAIKSGKHVVTANKALLAEHGKEIFSLAAKHHVFVNFEASVCGGVPIIKALSEGLSSNKISSILAIVNGTSNFILTKMQIESCSFKEALSEAQRLGFAEADPTLDISGMDSAHKLAILALLGFGYLPALKDVHMQGLREIQSCDMAYAEEMGLVIKPLAIAKIHKNDLELRVHPTFIPKSHVLANINGEYNAAFIHSDMMGDSLLYGKGAGRYPTASAVLSDIFDVARKSLSLRNIKIGSKNKNSTPEMFFANKIRVKSILNTESEYYIRITAKDKPGVLTKVSGILSRYGISIATVSQRIENKSGVVPVIMTTHLAKENAMRRSIVQIDKLNVIKGKTVVIRMENCNAS